MCPTVAPIEKSDRRDSAHHFEDIVDYLRTGDGLVLSARWMIPASNIVGALVLLPGEGGTRTVNFDGDVSGPLVGNPYRGGRGDLSKQIAEALAGRGIASLRYSKRGVEDPALLSQQTLPFLVKDAETALRQAKERFHDRPVGFVGFSEGSQIALHAIAKESVDALFLLSPITRGVDKIFRYQAVEWPISLLKKSGIIDSRGIIELAALERIGGALPGLATPPTKLDVDKDGKLTMDRDVLPAYEKNFCHILDLMQSPTFADWYEALKRAPMLDKIAKAVRAPVYFYHGTDDAQIKADWVLSDYSRFGKPPHLRTFANLGHCFSPMEGKLGEIKTSGPIDKTVLDAIASDALAVFSAK